MKLIDNLNELLIPIEIELRVYVAQAPLNEAPVLKPATHLPQTG
jgi:hypothetical protein